TNMSGKKPPAPSKPHQVQMLDRSAMQKSAEEAAELEKKAEPAPPMPSPQDAAAALASAMKAQQEKPPKQEEPENFGEFLGTQVQQAKKKPLLILIPIVAILVVTGILYALTRQGPPPDPGLRLAMGEVQIRHGPHESFQKTDLVDTAKTTVMAVNPNSSSVLEFGRGGTLRLDDQSTFQVDTLESTNIKITLDSGHVKVDTGPGDTATVQIESTQVDVPENAEMEASAGGVDPPSVKSDHGTLEVHGSSGLKHLERGQSMTIERTAPAHAASPEASASPAF
ncbi:MAG: DUF4097 family beta strand repeat-containing protein, partial [Candidatus Xenobia bacterium]